MTDTEPTTTINVSATRRSAYTGEPLTLDVTRGYDRVPRKMRLAAVSESVSLNWRDQLVYRVSIRGPRLTKTGKPHASQREDKSWETVLEPGVAAALAGVPMQVCDYLVGPDALLGQLLDRVKRGANH